MTGGRQGVLRGRLFFHSLDYARKRVMFMRDYEILSIVLQIMNCLLILLVALINSIKK